jgi:hypothetical protein
MRRLSMDENALIMDFGMLSVHSKQVFFHSHDTGTSTPVEDMAQGASGFIEAFLNQPASVLYSEIIQPHEKRRMMLHEVVRHQQIEERAFGIFQSPESTDADQNWLRAELELLHVALP